MNKYLVFLIALFFACGQQPSQEAQQPDTSTLEESKTPGELTWQAPAGWIEESPTSTMRKAQYRLPKAEADSEDGSVIIFYFQGQGGSVQANLERWYSQFAQPDGRPTRETADAKTTEVNNLTQTVVDIHGTYLFRPRPMAPTATEKPNTRMLAVVIETDSGPWFVKFVGPEKTVAKWEDSFRDFLASFRQ
ncbi:MAG: hypothetical protein ACE5IY_16145 [bacterium]